MKALFTKKTVIITILALAVAAIAILSLNTSGKSGFVSDVGGAVTSPLKRVASSVARMFENIYGNLYEYENVMVENEQLKAEIAELRQEYREYSDVAKENDRLRELFDFSKRHAGQIYDSAVILSWSASNWSSSFTISKGSSNSDVAVGDCIITASGVLVGCVTAVESTWSTAVSVLDTSFTAGALVGKNGATATAMGDFSYMRQGLLKLDYIQADADILTGDAIVTSGAGGKFPNGLTIGDIVEVSDYGSGLGRYATIRPAVQFDTVSHVYIITDFVIMD